MCGKLSSVGIVVARLKDAGCVNWAVTEFVQGAKTRRWGVAWSWGGWRPAVRVARGINGRALRGTTATIATRADAAKHSQKYREQEEEPDRLDGGFLPFPSEFSFEIAFPSGPKHLHGEVVAEEAAAAEEAVARKLNSELHNLDRLQWQWKPSLGIGLGIAADGDCWSRKARRRKEQQSRSKPQKKDEDAMMREGGGSGSEEDTEDDDEEGKEPELVFKIQIQRLHTAKTEEEEEEDGWIRERTPGDEDGEVTAKVRVTIRWLRGYDHVLFESFAGWLKRKIGSGVQILEGGR